MKENPRFSSLYATSSPKYKFNVKDTGRSNEFPWLNFAIKNNIHKIKEKKQMSHNYFKYI